ncbi:preprotein translocase subunit YajC [Candidatus Zixiibacteriota bacterium]
MSTVLLAMSQPSGGSGGGGGMLTILPWLLIMFLIFYVFMIRPQQKKQQSHRKMLADLQRGDRVVTSGGFLATILNIKEKENVIVLKLGENLKVEIQKSAIAGKIEQREP